MAIRTYKTDAWQDIESLKVNKDGVFADAQSAMIDVGGVQEEVYPNKLWLIKDGVVNPDTLGNIVFYTTDASSYSIEALGTRNNYFYVQTSGGSVNITFCSTKVVSGVKGRTACVDFEGYLNRIPNCYLSIMFAASNSAAVETRDAIYQSSKTNRATYKVHNIKDDRRLYITTGLAGSAAWMKIYNLWIE